MTSIPRFVISGTNSGCGKTTLSVGIMAALVKRGLKVQPFKVGPDYIDPMFHTFITGRYSRNLDSWMLDEDTVAGLFAKNACGSDIAVIEGVMGLYDGFEGSSLTGSTAHVSKITGSPVILVINGEGMSLSAAALVRGYKDFDRELDVRGVIINNINSDGHYRLLKEIIEEHGGLAVVGYLPSSDAYSLPDRHLGLVTSAEIDDLKQRVEALSEQIQKTVDIDRLLELSRQAGEVKSGAPMPPVPCREKVRIGVAWDKAFCFYYRDNFDLLEMMGAELEFFSPVGDSRLPEGIDGLYIGGGYPEVWAGELMKNEPMKKEIRENILKGMPAYAECGGLMYLSQSIADKCGGVYGMVGVIPGKSEMTSSLKRFGYVDIEVKEDCVLSKKGGKIRGHEFHYSVTEVSPGAAACYRVTKNRKNGKPAHWECGFKVNNLLAGYPHLHFWSNTRFAEEFVENCLKYKNLKREG
ncbi:MAG: cobyrinate a,c-diamide synthase [Clostridiales bacterium]|jgi:cobyrinic acid a,c-diamide synthase|nr:cobyrinate a,c-diamide synthase [Eubacteriales bacterium]MDH7565739.1 cobyrinate a,c-diamide synthase [Clostridiales bacterium]